MLGRRKFRFTERLEARLSGEPKDITLTQEDEDNLDAFVETLKEAVQLLRTEVEAINNGQLSIVSELYERKAHLLKWLELKLPVVESFLPHEHAQSKNLHGHLEDLKQAATEDSELLSRMSTAAHAIVREIEKTNERNGLGGIYGKSGQKLGDVQDGELRIDREF
jgi:flagellar biosynthesis/type III secretory pathway chaperone